MARKNPKIFRQNGHGPEQKGLAISGMWGGTTEIRVERTEARGDRLTPTPLHSPSGAGED